MLVDPFLKDALDRIVPYIEKYKNEPNLELEFRLGFFEDNVFNTAIPDEFYSKIKSTLETNPHWESTRKTQTVDYFHEGMRLSVGSDGKSICIKKIKLVSIDFTFENTPFDVRVSLSQEVKIPESSSLSKEYIGKIENIYKREKTRTSYLHKFWSFDVTNIKTVENTIEEVTHEIELEVVNFANQDISYIAYSSLLKIKDLVNMCEKIESNYGLVFKQIFEKNRIR